MCRVRRADHAGSGEVAVFCLGPRGGPYSAGPRGGSYPPDAGPACAFYQKGGEMGKCRLCGQRTEEIAEALGLCVGCVVADTPQACRGHLDAPLSLVH